MLFQAQCIPILAYLEANVLKMYANININLKNVL